MNVTAILYAVLTLGGLGLVFGAILNFADKIFHVPVDERVSLAREALPGANCGACGYAGCDAFAEAVVNGTAHVNGCIPGGVSCANILAEIMGVKAEERKPMMARVYCQGENGVAKQRYVYEGYRSCLLAANMAGGPKCCTYACIGLGDCVAACKFDALTIENGIAKVHEDKCTACGMCASLCPRHSIQLTPRNATVTVRCHNRDTAKAARDACANACIGCMRCEKQCKVGAITMEDACARIDFEKCTHCGECAGVCPMKCITVEGK